MQGDTNTPKVETRPRLSFKDKIPSNWVITEGKKGIIAVNSVSGEKFEGTVNEFNNGLRT